MEFRSLIGKRVLVFCMNYIYTGVVGAITESQIRLDDAAIVYETGAFTSKSFTDAQKLTFPVFVQGNSIESISETDKI